MINNLFIYLMQGFEQRDYYGKLIIGLELVYSFYMTTRALSYICDSIITDSNIETMMIAHISRLIELASEFNDMAAEHFKQKGMDTPEFILKLIS